MKNFIEICSESLIYTMLCLSIGKSNVLVNCIKTRTKNYRLFHFASSCYSSSPTFFRVSKWNSNLHEKLYRNTFRASDNYYVMPFNREVQCSCERPKNSEKYLYVIPFWELMLIEKPKIFLSFYMELESP